MAAALKRDALRLYRDIIRTARNFPWPNEAGRPWRDVLIESARTEFEDGRNLDDPNEAMRRILVGRHCLEEAAKKFETKRQEILAEQKRSGSGAPSGTKGGGSGDRS